RGVGLHDHHAPDLAAVTVRAADGTTSTLHTTWHHRFWNATAARWTDAVDLTPGTALRTAGGPGAVVVSVRARAGQREMPDLTVPHTHPYYVPAGTTPVLAPNRPDDVPPLSRFPRARPGEAEGERRP